MYSDSSKILISKRVGWSIPTDSLIQIVIQDDNLIATSGRTVDSFHQLASVDNLFYTVNKNNTEEESFNTFLENMRYQASLEVLNKILDQHKDYDFNKDYDSTINKYQSLFDEPLGYLLAIKCIELFINSSRSNAIERNVKLSFEILKIELDGVKNDNGHLVSNGLTQKFFSSIKRAQKIIFPTQIEIIGEKVW